MSDFNTLDSALQGRATDPAIREGIALVDYPDYLIAEALSGDGLRQVHNSIGAGSLTPEAAAQAITARIVEGIAEGIAKGIAKHAPEDSSHERKNNRGRASFIPTPSTRFPKPIVSRIFGKKNVPREELVFDDEAEPINFSSPLSASLLMRAEAVSQLWRQGRLEGERAAHLLVIAVEDFQTHQDKV